MRFITSCPQCHVQYWSDEIETRDSIYCYCGTMIPLKAAPWKDARVVRCSSCGGARQKGASSCTFCHSDFTIHEKDLNTVCPECMARISDTASFCHYCGVQIHPNFSTGKASALQCPACDGSRPLYLRTEANHLPFFECRICAGIWLKREFFEEVVKKSESDEAPALLEKVSHRSGTISKIPKEEAGPQTRFYRPCPACHNVMNRRNVGTVSGIIIDFCKPDGVWFDGNELAQMIQWIRRGGLRKTKEKSVLQKTLPKKSPSQTLGPVSLSRPWGSRSDDFLDGIVDSISDFF